ncbi:MAG: FtsX-like permease family protein [Bryobacteraceae bacterium]
MNLSLRTAGRIAWRETRSSLTKFLFVVLAVAAGVGALSGVRGFSQSFHGMLTKEARTVMAADLTARQFAMPTPQQDADLDALRNVDRTLITETFSMASTQSPDVTPLLVSIKAVDPAKYPYYGEVKLAPEIPLASALTADTVAAGDDLMIRLHLKVGDEIRLAGQDYRVSATVISEPDRMSGSMNVGLRLMMSREALMRTGLLQLGSRAAERLLFKLNPGAPGVEQVRKAIKAALPESLVADFRQSHPIITNGLDRATVFLSLVSLIALIVGAIGVGMAMHAHLQQKMDNIAVMKSIGATSNEIIRIYTLQTLMLGVLGGIAGVAVGRGVEEILPRLITKFFTVGGAMGWHVAASAQGIAVGMLTTLLFTLPPLLAIRKIRPALILRRDMPEARLPWRQRIGEGREALAVGGIILIGIGGVATWLAESARVGGYFAGGLVTSLIALTGVAWLLLRGIREFLKRSPWRVPSLVRQGLANLYRQGNQAQAILVALGLGVMFTLSVYLIQDSLVGQIVETAPPGMPNVFLVGITQAQVEPLKELLAKQEGVVGTPEFVPSVMARLVSINGTPLAETKLQGMSRRFLYSRSVMWENEIPEQTRVLEGAWWKAGTTEPVVSIAEDAAHNLNLHPGAWIEMSAAGRTIGARVVAVHQTEAIRVSAANEFVFNTKTLAGLPVIYYGGVRMKPALVGSFQRNAYEKFPTVTVVNVADALEIVQQVVDQIALVIRFLSGFAILAGAIILAASIAGTRFRRVREVVILKTLGATRRHVGRIFSVEFLTLGAVAGLMGALLAAIFSSLVLKRLLNAHFHFDPKATGAAILLTAALANLSGWLASFRILRQKPLEVLRDE